MGGWGLGEGSGRGFGGWGVREGWLGGGSRWGDLGWGGGNMPPRPSNAQSQAPLTSPCRPPSNHAITINLVESPPPSGVTGLTLGGGLQGGGGTLPDHHSGSRLKTMSPTIYQQEHTNPVR